MYYAPITTINGFFDMLRERKWAFYIPERVHSAHLSGNLYGWGMRDIREIVEKRHSGYWDMRYKFYLIESICPDLKIPLLLPEEKVLNGAGRQVIQRLSNYITTYDKREDCPRLPIPILSPSIITSDNLWDSMREHLGLIKAQTRRIVAWNNWVYWLQFCSVWVSANNKSDGIPEERRRVLREYGLTSEYNKPHKATLVLLGGVYPPEQVQHIRRQLEDKLRKDPAEVIRLSDRVRR